VFLERDDGRCEVLVRGSVHVSRKRTVGRPSADLENIHVIRIENDHTSP
jgi:hypothetical protein